MPVTIRVRPLPLLAAGWQVEAVGHFKCKIHVIGNPLHEVFGPKLRIIVRNGFIFMISSKKHYRRHFISH